MMIELLQAENKLLRDETTALKFQICDLLDVLKKPDQSKTNLSSSPTYASVAADSPSAPFITVRKGSRARQYPATASPELINRFASLDLWTELEMKKEKSLNAVIVNLPESESDDETEIRDNHIVEELLIRSGLDITTTMTKVTRHGRKHPNRPRILKTRFF